MEVMSEKLTKEHYEEMKKVIRENVCAECGGELTIRSNPETGNLEIWCPHNPDHRGYIERETWTQVYRRGGDVHPSVRDRIERRMILPGGQPIGAALIMIQTRFPKADMDEQSAALFLWDCVRLDLDPLLGEIFPATFKVKSKGGTERKVVQPIISEDGWLSLAARSCAEAWAGAPKTMRLEEYLQMQDSYREKTYDEVKNIAREIKIDLCKDPEAYVWVAIGHRKGQEDTATYGWYKNSEEGIVAKGLPGNQARVRAIKRWVREVFPEAKAKMKEITAAWMQRAGDVRDIQNLIETEYHIITEEPPSKIEGEGTHADRMHGVGVEPLAASENIEGEGFNIDTEWLKQSLAQIKWSDETTRSYLANKFHIDTRGAVNVVLTRLNRQQAEEFVKEIQNRAAQQALWD